MNFLGTFVESLYKQKIAFLLLVMAGLLLHVAVVHAIILQSEKETVSIRASNPTMTADTFTVIVSAKGNVSSLQNARTSVRFVEPDTGVTVSSRAYEKALNALTHVNVPRPVLDGTYSTFVQVTHPDGAVIANAFAGTLDFSAALETRALLDACMVTGGSSVECMFVQEGDISEVVLEYTIDRIGGGANDEHSVKSISTSIEDARALFQLPETLSPGRYTLTLKTVTDENVSYGTETRTVFEVPGTWAAFERRSSERINATTVSGSLHVVRGEVEAPLILVYGAVDAQGALCGSVTDVSLVSHRARTYSVESAIDAASGCLGAHIAAVVIDEGNNVLAQTNTAARQLLEQRSTGAVDEEVVAPAFGDIQEFVAPIVAGGVLMLVIVVFVFLRRRGASMPIAMLFVGAFMPVSVVFGVTFYSLDSDRYAFVVTLDQETYVPGSDVGFTFSFSDTADIVPSQFVIEARINNNEWQTVIDPATENALYHRTLPGLDEEGAHVLFMRIHGACGSAFSFSLFETARFGSGNCEIAVAFDGSTPDENDVTTIIFDNPDGGDGIATLEDLSLQAIPVIVSPQQTTQIHWDTVDVRSCSVSGSNGDGPWTGLSSPDAGHTTSGITAETTYTLSCIDANDDVISKSIQVRLVPIWEEF